MEKINRASVGDIPLIWVEPENSEMRKLVIWLTGFGGDKERVSDYVLKLADAGFIGLSFDPYQHGERRIEPQEELGPRVRGALRRYFWPILAHTAEETPKIVDWAIDTLGVDKEVGMGGISMGGDISAAATGVDHRITVVAAGIATPDWMRPGSFEPPGEPDDYAQTCYERVNPLTHLENYRHLPAISFQNGAEDEQVPPDGSLRFIEALKKDAYSECPQRLEAVLHQGVAHSFTEEGWENCISWFKEHL